MGGEEEGVGYGREGRKREWDVGGEEEGVGYGKGGEGMGYGREGVEYGRDAPTWDCYEKGSRMRAKEVKCHMERVGWEERGGWRVEGGSGMGEMQRGEGKGVRWCGGERWVEGGGEMRCDGVGRRGTKNAEAVKI